MRWTSFPIACTRAYIPIKQDPRDRATIVVRLHLSLDPWRKVCIAQNAKARNPIAKSPLMKRSPMCVLMKFSADTSFDVGRI